MKLLLTVAKSYVYCKTRFNLNRESLGEKMFAVIKTGSKQYKVTTGDVLKVEKLAADEGSEVIFDQVLALDEKIGKPFVKGASVKATVLKQAKDAKVIIFKKKRRHNYRRKNGHRQQITLVKILDVCAKDKE